MTLRLGQIKIIGDDLTERVGITALINDSATLKTVELLGYVYNGGSTSVKEIECANLRNEHLLPDIQRFRQYIRGYNDEPDLGYDKLIEKEINRSSKFAAFKRRIIQNNPRLSAVFADSLQ